MSSRAFSGVLVVLAALALAGCSSSSPAPVYDRMAADAPPPVVGHLKDGSLVIRVQRGDTAYGIARSYNVSLRALIERNGLRPPYLLQVGQALAIPKSRVYVVRKGDTLYSIARNNGVDLNALIRVNRVRPPYTIRAGQELRLPDRWDSGRTAVAATSPPPSPPPPSASEQKERWLPREAEKTAKPPPPPTTPAVTQPRAPRPPPQPVREPPRRSGGFIWPARGEVVSRFGTVGRGLRNDGINIALPRGTEIVAAETGVVAYAGNELRGFGNMLLIKHDGGWMSAYAHLDEITVARGQTVRRGDPIGRAGATGNVTTPQLHFELRKSTKAVDPLRYLSTQKAERE